VFARVDLDLQAHSRYGSEGCLEAIEESETSLALLPFRATEPRIKGLTDGVDQLADGAGVTLNEVDVLRIPTGCGEEHLMQGGSSTKDGLVGYPAPAW
jgi:hypothetical protein